MPSPDVGSTPAPPAASAPATSPTPPPAASPTADPGGAPALYNETQAARGRQVFVDTCYACHYSSEFHDAEFQFTWGRRTVWDLFRDIRMNMPDDDPGSLALQQYIDVVAYILQLNGFPMGDAELAADENALASYRLASPKG